MNEKTDKFWNWFIANNERLTMLSEYNDDDKQKLLNELQDALTEYCDGLSFDMGDQTQNGRQLVFTAEGDIELFRYVVELVENAPDLDWWEFIPFKQPYGENVKIHFDKYHLDSQKMYFLQLENEEEPDILGLRIALKNADSDDEDLLVAVYVTLEAMIGEFDCATLLGYFELCEIPEDPKAEGFKPLTDFPKFIEWFKKQRDE